jgi:glucose/arabinose dehydrogenase
MQILKLLFIFLFFSCFPTKEALSIPNISLPPGFKISVFAEVPDARSLTKGPDGVLFVGTRESKGSVYLVSYKKGEEKAQNVKEVAKNLNAPNGVAFRDGNLYVGEIEKILLFPQIMEKTVAPTALAIQLPNETHHGYRYLKFSPNGELIVAIGSPCNVCDKGGDFGKIFAVDIKSGKKRMIAQGIRNSVGFDFHPTTKELWFTDNGRDWLGDDSPPDELNRLEKEGSHFGFPHCHGKNLVDTEFGVPNGCKDFVPPARELGAHVASLGMVFYTGNNFPPEYKNQIFIAEHGSWNRKVPQGYRVTMVKLSGNEAVDYSVFAEGWLSKDFKKLGRPVDLLVLEDGSLIVSDDFAGLLYRITYSK